MATAPINDFKKCWYPYTGRFTGQSRPMSYWIQFPDEALIQSVRPEWTPPEDGYPILIMLQGGSLRKSYGQFETLWAHTYKTPTTGGATVEKWRPNDTNSPYYSYPAICILPDTTDYDEWLDTTFVGQDTFRQISFGCGHWAGVKIVRELIEHLILDDIVFYSDETCTLENVWDITVPAVDTDRIYASGYSYGGGAMMGIARDMRDMMAGMVMGGGFPVKAYQDIYYGGAHYDPLMADVLLRYARRMYHIPILAHCGRLDGMYDASTGLLNAMSDLESEMGSPHNMRLAYAPDVGHIGGWVGWTSYKTKLFDADVKTPQEFQSSGTGLTNSVEWLFSQTKPETPEDPYPNETDEVLIENVGYWKHWGLTIATADHSEIPSAKRSVVTIDKLDASLKINQIVVMYDSVSSVIKIVPDTHTSETVLDTLDIGEEKIIHYNQMYHRVKFLSETESTFSFEVTSPILYSSYRSS